MQSISIDGAPVKPIPGFPDYLVSSTGVVYSRKVYGSRCGRCGPWWPMKLKTSKSRYFHVDLFREKGKPERFFVHQLVLLAFVGPCPDRQEVRHLDDNRRNNQLTNLCYGTKQDNYLDSVRNGLACVGQKRANAKLTNEDVRTIRQLAAEGVRHRAIGERFGVSRHHVAKICCREIWRHVD